MDVDGVGAVCVCVGGAVAVEVEGVGAVSADGAVAVEVDGVGAVCAEGPGFLGVFSGLLPLVVDLGVSSPSVSRSYPSSSSLRRRKLPTKPPGIVH